MLALLVVVVWVVPLLGAKKGVLVVLVDYPQVET